LKGKFCPALQTKLAVIQKKLSINLCSDWRQMAQLAPVKHSHRLATASFFHLLKGLAGTGATWIASVAKVL
jgi:hypothetical protein